MGLRLRGDDGLLSAPVGYTAAMPSSQPPVRQSFVRSSLAALVVGVAFLNAGCGLKAPLYLPDEKEQEVAPAQANSGKRRVTPQPAPQAQKQDRIDAGESQDVPAPTPPADSDSSATPPPSGN